MGLDPGIRTGVKVAVVDATGKLVETATVYPHEPRRDWMAPCTRWPGCAKGMVCSSLPSVTARPAAKPTSWRASSSN